MKHLLLLLTLTTSLVHTVPSDGNVHKNSNLQAMEVISTEFLYTIANVRKKIADAAQRITTHAELAQAQSRCALLASLIDCMEKLVAHYTLEPNLHEDLLPKDFQEHAQKFYLAPCKKLLEEYQQEIKKAQTYLNGLNKA